ncbi:MAG: ATP-binding protein [Chromatiaceae bacterium]|nr:ATP-binding protein [Chromatiaceae bacterium]
MRIAVASGKGGTGKTTLSSALALVAAGRYATRLLDCDVEAPNAALALRPSLSEQRAVSIPVPRVDEARCTHCGRCAEVCRFNALAVTPRQVLVFDELCHGCGSCVWICPEQAMSESEARIGMLDAGTTETGIDFAQGSLDVGQSSGVPILRALKRWTPAAWRVSPRIEIRDAPPGASCAVVETLRDVDAALLVTEPTPFGLHDLKQVVAICRELGLPTAVAINRDGIGDAAVEDYCAEQALPILLRIPLERHLAESLAQGNSLIEAAPEYREPLARLLQGLIELAEAPR